MKRSKIYGVIVVVTILSIVFITDVSARIIPAAEQAKTNAEPYEHTDVITLNVDANWELNLPDNSAPPTAPTANDKIILAFDMGKPNDNAQPYEHSPAIGPGWVLTVPPNITGVDSFAIGAVFEVDNTLFEPLGAIQNDIARPLDVPFESSTFTSIPEPATICLLGLGGLLLRKRRA